MQLETVQVKNKLDNSREAGNVERTFSGSNIGDIEKTDLNSCLTIKSAHSYIPRWFLFLLIRPVLRFMEDENRASPLSAIKYSQCSFCFSLTDVTKIRAEQDVNPLQSVRTAMRGGLISRPVPPCVHWSISGKWNICKAQDSKQRQIEAVKRDRNQERMERPSARQLWDLYKTHTSHCNYLEWVDPAAESQYKLYADDKIK